MTDEQITALSRQFAEEMCSEMEDSFEKDEAFQHYELTFQLAVGFLSEHSCFVERWIDPKDQLPEIRERVLICEKIANQYKVFIGKRVPSPCANGWEWNQSTKESVVAWMPLPQYRSEIGKEEENE